jgi:hypothetical protein
MHAKPFKRLRRVLKRQHTILDMVMRGDSPLSPLPQAQHLRRIQLSSLA